MKLLLDTNMVLWTASDSIRLPDAARAALEDRSNELWFSVVSIWEIAIKQGLNRTDFRFDARAIRDQLLDNGFQELVMTSAHAIAIGSLPLIHKDPFDRLLIAQAMAEGVTLLTVDSKIAKYPGSILKV
jgi:PIN domain nuclease of toxin-antitoxin system